MRKYIEVLKLQFKTEMSFRLDIAFTMLFTVIRVLFALIVWPAVFEGQTEIAGFTLPGMLSFYVVSSFIAGLDISEGIAWEMGDRIRHGTFTKFLILPCKPETYFQFQTFGASLLHLIFAFTATVLWAVLFQIPLTLTSDPAAIFSAVLMVGLGLCFMNQFNFAIGMLAFKFLDISTFLIFKNDLIAFLTGSLLPLALLPGWARGVMRFFPFYYVNNLPSMLLIGQGREETAMGFGVLLLWIAAFFFIDRVGFKALRRRYDGVGV